MLRNPSPQQTGFFDWIENGTGSCVLEAVAGAGKTTTLVEALQLMHGKIFFGAYNKKIADEIKHKAPPMDTLTVSTLHAAGFKDWLRVARGCQVQPNGKCRDIFREASERQPQYKQYESAVLQLVSYAKQAGVGVLAPMNDRATWENLIDHFDVEIPQPWDAFDEVDPVLMTIKLARATLKRSIEMAKAVIDFDDMIYMPLLQNVKLTQYDWVLIDEAQDTNATRRELAIRKLKPGGRLVAVGDRHQAIYGFTGADADALDLIAAATNAKRLPLTVTYRCPKSVVNHAHQWVQHITAHPSAPDGKVTTLDGPLSKSAVPGDAILCRFNAPLLEHVYQFISAGIPAKVEGREIGAGLIELSRRWKVKSLEKLEERLETYLEREQKKYRAKDQESRAAGVEDKVTCLRVFISRVRAACKGEPANPLEALANEINAVFGDVSAGQAREVVLFSSIHKSKGREWRRVFWLQTGPSTFARQEWEQQQERNLCYVATTRAKEELILCAAERSEKKPSATPEPKMRKPRLRPQQQPMTF